MADGTVRVGDKNIDNTELTITSGGASTVQERQRINIAGANPTDLVPANSYDGLATYDAAVLDMLSNILVELRVQTLAFQVLLATSKFEVDDVRDACIRKLD